MNLKRSSLLFLFTIVFSVQAFQTTLQFRETSFNLRDHSFINSDQGWAAGEPHWDQEQKRLRGTIIATADGAQSWQRLDVPLSEAFNGVHFVDTLYGWAVGVRGAVLHTSDGGQSWTPQAPGITDELRGVFFVNRSVGFIVGALVADNNTESDRQGIIYKTTDGGQNWQSLSLPENSGAINSAFFINENFGWLAGSLNNSGVLLRTTDGGQGWSVQHTSREYNYFSSVYFTDSENGWASSFNVSGAASGATAIKTTNGGDSWQEMNVDYNLRDIHFADNLRGYAVGFRPGASPPVLRTLDGGQTWQRLTINRHRGEGLFAVYASVDRMISVGQRDFTCLSGTPWGDDDNGSILTQLQLNPQYRFWGVHFADRLRGWAVGIKLYIDRGTQIIMYTDDGGVSWTEQHETDSVCGTRAEGMHRLNDITFVDGNTGWAVGYTDNVICDGINYSVLYTENGGIDWEPVFDRVGERILSVAARENGGAWLLPENPTGRNTEIFSTSDIGATWDETSTSEPGPLQSQGKMFFLDDLQGWAVGGEDGFVMYTDDGGQSWQKRDQVDHGGELQGKLYTVNFPSASNGWIGGSNLYQTVDAGQSWILRDDVEFDYGDITSIQFTSQNNGWIAGANGMVMRTTDGGSTWEKEQGTRANHLRYEDMHIVDDSTGWAVAGAGTIVKIDASASSPIRYVWGSRRGSNNTFSIKPLAGSILVNVDLNTDSNVRIDIVDLKGRVVNTVFNNKLSAGTHQLNIHTGHISKGMYLLRYVNETNYYQVLPFILSR